MYPVRKMSIDIKLIQNWHKEMFDKARAYKTGAKNTEIFLLFLNRGNIKGSQP